MYSSPYGSDWTSYKTPGAVVVCGRGNFNDPEFRELSDSGATVLFYIDPFLGLNGSPQPSFDKYGQLLKDSSIFGSAVPLWPGMPQASASGWLLDFRPSGTTLHTKWPKVLDMMAQECPHIGGWFFDDVGTRSFYSGIDWNTVSAQDKQDYRDGAIQICQEARTIADKYKLMFVVNGTWNANDGGGYPDSTKHGCSIADGGLIEGHTLDAFWTAYSTSTQWASQSALTQGNSLMWVYNQGDCTSIGAYTSANIVAFATCQSNDTTPIAPWGSFHPTRLPTSVTFPGTVIFSDTFETGSLSGWNGNGANPTYSTTQAYAGTGSMRIAPAGGAGAGWAYHQTPVALTAGKEYQLSARVLVPSALSTTARLRLVWDFGSNNFVDGPDITATGSWVVASVSGIAPSVVSNNDSYLQVVNYTSQSNTSDVVFADNVILREI
jgi:hypothetical protein